jgi:hypothetical protein
MGAYPEPGATGALARHLPGVQGLPGRTVSTLSLSVHTLDPQLRDGETCNPQIIKFAPPQPCPARGHPSDRQPADGQSAKRDRAQRQCAYSDCAEGDGSLAPDRWYTARRRRRNLAGFGRLSLFVTAHPALLPAATPGVEQIFVFVDLGDVGTPIRSTDTASREPSVADKSTVTG